MSGSGAELLSLLARQANVRKAEGKHTDPVADERTRQKMRSIFPPLNRSASEDRTESEAHNETD